MIYVEKTSASGSGQVICQITNACGTVTLRKNVKIDAIEPQISPANYYVQVGEELKFQVANPQPDWEYTWEVIDVNADAFFMEPSQIYSPAVWIGTYSVGRFYVRLHLTNSCGATGETTIDYMATIGGNPPGFRFGPNPANTILTVEHDGLSSERKVPANGASAARSVKDDLNRIVDYKLLNESGKVVMTYKNKLSEKNSVLNVASLPNGTYYLHISDGKSSWKKQVIVKH